MKKIVLLFFITVIGSLQLFAQFEVVGSDKYGRIFNLVYDPQTESRIFALTLENHILVSNDNGLSWNIFYSTPPGYTVQKLKFTKNGTALSFVKYAGKTPYNRLTLIDANSGEEIQEFTPPNCWDNAWITSYSICANNTDTVLISTSWQEGIANYGKAFFSSNGGNSWKEVYYTEDNATIFLNNVAIDPGNPQKLFLLRGNGSLGSRGGILISNDGGNTWEEKLAGSTLNPVAFNPAGSGDIFVGTDIGWGTHPECLYRSSDGGNTWTQQAITWQTGILNNITAIEFNPANPNHIIALEESEIVISKDNGASWQKYSYDPYGYDINTYYYGIDVSFNPFKTNELVISANYFPLFSTDGGITLTKMDNPYFQSTGNVKYVSAKGEEHLYYGVQFGYVHRNLQNSEEAPYKFMELYEVANDPGIGFFVDEAVPGRVYTWANSGGGGWFSKGQEDEIQKDFGMGGRSLTVSDDHGATERASLSVENMHCEAIGISPSNRNIVWAYFSGYSPDLQKIDFSGDFGAVGTSVALPKEEPLNPGGQPVYGIYVYEDSPDHVLVTYGAEIYVTTDGAASWTQITSGLESLDPENDLILSLAQNPLNKQQLTITTNKGIFTSQDEGNTWTKIFEGLTHCVAHSTLTNGVILAASHNTLSSNFELFYTKNGGSNWNKVGTEDMYYLEAMSVASKFTNEGIEVYINSADLGLVKYTIVFASGVNLNTNTIELALGKTETALLTATVSPDETTNKDVTWQSDNEAVATVEDGLVTAVAEGIAIITVTTKDGGYTDKATVTVSKGTNLNLIYPTAIQVYPNPAHKELHIKIPCSESTELTEMITITDLSGRVTGRQSAVSLQNGVAIIDVSYLPQGIYILKIGKYKGRFVKE